MKFLRNGKFLSGIALLLICGRSYAQLDSCNAFLQGSYIEVGINTNGAFGSSVSAPPGYHPKGGSPVFNSCYPSLGTFVPGGTNLGFVADPAKDGWTVGSPPYFGDYFLPGSPQEGWSLQVDNYRVDAWNGAILPPSPFQYTSAAHVQPGYGNMVYTIRGKRKVAIWEGIFDSLQITQTTVMDTTTVFFTVYVAIHNLSATTKHNLYYLRTVDPDNDQPEPSGDFTTHNTIDYQLPNARGATLVSALGRSSPLAYLGLGTLDCRARCFYLSNQLAPTSGTGTGNGLDAIYGTPLDGYSNPTCRYSGDTIADVGMGLVYKLEDLAAGEFTTLAYAYILNKNDLDSAFETTRPQWQVAGDTNTFNTGDSVLVCANSSTTVRIANSGGKNWIWSSATGNHLSYVNNTSVLVDVDSTPVSLMAIGKNGSCVADTIYMNLFPKRIELSPRITASRTTLCIGDTMLLWFSGIIPDTNSTIKWAFGNAQFVAGPDSGIGKGPYELRWGTAGKQPVSVTVHNWTCTATVTDTIQVIFAPAVSFTVPQPICVGDTISIIVDDFSLLNAKRLLWDFGGGEEIKTNKPSSYYTLRYKTDGQKIIKLSIDYGTCIRDPRSDTVTVRPLPEAHIINISRNDICTGDTATLTAMANPDYTYSWSPVQFFNQNQGYGPEYAVTGTIQYTALVYVTIKDQYNCKATDSVLMQTQPCCEVAFPSAFSPNGDGRNDLFRPIAVGNHRIRELRIVNRYGETVFHTSKEKNGWDGRFMGVPQEVGTYYYYFSYECNGNIIVKKGDLALIR
ncbi:MAG: gliding motility-associated C-terminal domain-containing protein [Taibaiella sp.]|nr:gliding motility-associated C-terminal domain-containing protein [Taibaiella sp.]